MPPARQKRRARPGIRQERPGRRRSPVRLSGRLRAGRARAHIRGGPERLRGRRRGGRMPGAPQSPSAGRAEPPRAPDSANDPGRLGKAGGRVTDPKCVHSDPKYMPANPKHKSAGTLPLGAHSKAPRPPYKGGSAVFISLRAKHECLVQILAIKSPTYWILADISHCFVWNVPKNTSQCQQSANQGPSGTIRAQNCHGARQNPAALPFEVSYPPSRRHRIFHISICANSGLLTYCVMVRGVKRV